jgi:Dolichyl-phosphate-mannose-protein mannosyltransferase
LNQLVKFFDRFRGPWRKKRFAAALTAEGSGLRGMAADLLAPDSGGSPISAKWYLLGVALFLRAALPAIAYQYTRDPTIFYGGDSSQYVALASSLVTHHRFFSDGSSAARAWNVPTASAPELLRTPGYPLLLAVGQLTGHLVLTTIAVQILLGCFTVYLVYLIARLVSEDETVSLAAVALHAADPLAILFSSLISTETVFTFLTMVGVYSLLRYLRSSSLVPLFISALFFVCSIYVRPAAYYLPLCLSAALIASAWVSARPNKVMLMVHMAAFLGIVLCLLGGCRIRNQVLANFSGFSSAFSEDMYCNGAAAVIAKELHQSYRSAQERMGCYDLGVYLQRHPEQRGQSVAQIVDHERAESLRIFFKYPLTELGIYLQGVIRSTFDPGSTEFVRFFDLYPKNYELLDTAVDEGAVSVLTKLLDDRPLLWSTAVLLAVQLTYLALAVRGIANTSSRNPQVLLLLIVMTYFLLLPGGASAWGRYRLPAMPIVCLLAACGLMLRKDLAVESFAAPAGEAADFDDTVAEE